MKKGLTKRENQTLRVIEDYIIENKHAPTIKEIGSIIGWSSTSTVYVFLERLIDKGYIEKEKNKSRSLKVINHV
ncbi:transcriptional regulator [Paenibacillus phytohabitans]|nr:transcriptional regulator [Paenibacillus phytohabitans]